jgi:hypothetical protein
MPDAFTIALATEARYLRGLPTIVGVAIGNVSAGAHASLPFFDRFTVPGPVTFHLQGPDGWSWNSRPRSSRAPSEKVAFGPGTSWLGLQDLNELGARPVPGRYHISAELRFPGHVVRSRPDPIEMLSPTASDLNIVEALRSSAQHDSLRWRDFITENLTLPLPIGLSPEAQARLAYHLCWHRVIHGRLPVSALDPEEPWQLGQGLLEGQAALHRLEILHARSHDLSDGLAEAVRERWPGLAWWISRIQDDTGPLASLRAAYGFEPEELAENPPGEDTGDHFVARSRPGRLAEAVAAKSPTSRALTVE